MLRAMNGPGAPRHSLLADLDARLAAIAERARRATDGLDEARLRAVPPGGGWSMGQVLEHVIVLDGDYMAAMARVLDQAGAPAGGHRPWRPTLAGRLLVWAMREQNRLKAPTAPRYDGLTPRADVAAAFGQHVSDLAGLLRRADGHDLRALRVRSPVNGAIVVNLGDAARMLVVHAERHMGQLERVRAAVAPGMRAPV